MPQPYPHGELVIVIDCSDLDRSARFWSEVLGYTAGQPSTGPYRGLQPESGAGIDVLLQRVPDAKRQKNRLHLDLRTPDLEAEVRRVLDLGATLLTDRARRGGRLVLAYPGRSRRQRVLRAPAAGLARP